MRLVRILRPSQWWAPLSGPCILCKKLALFVARPSDVPVAVPDEVASRLIASGAAEEPKE